MRYTPGKADWFASGLPGEGNQAGIPHAGELARPDVPTCRLTDRIGDVRVRARARGWDVCVVINDHHVVLGLLREKELDSDLPAAVELVMESGPTTIRPNWTLEKTTDYMHKQGMNSILVTTSDGRLIGLVSRQDAERRLEDFQASTQRG